MTKGGIHAFTRVVIEVEFHRDATDDSGVVDSRFDAIPESAARTTNGSKALVLDDEGKTIGRSIQHLEVEVRRESLNIHWTRKEGAARFVKAAVGKLKQASIHLGSPIQG